MAAVVSRESTAAQVRRILSERILNGELVPGVRLREMHIAAEFKISQAPVREALRELEMLGLVHTEPYRGTSVRQVTKKDIREAYIVRSSLEELAGRLAAPIFKGDVGHLRELATAVQDAAQKNDVAEYVKRDVAFHRAIVETTGNRILLRSWDALGFEVRMQMRLVNSSIDLAKIQKEHWPIIQALDDGEQQKAGKLLQQHVFRFSRMSGSRPQQSE